jgi:hypothetical protein
MWFGGALSTSQIFSALAVVVGTAFLLIDRRRVPERA